MEGWDVLVGTFFDDEMSQIRRVWRCKRVICGVEKHVVVKQLLQPLGVVKIVFRLC